MKILSSLIGLSIIMLISCNKNNSTLVNSNIYFPNEVGNRYVYTVNDSASNKTFAVTVATAGNSTVGTKAVTIWTFTYPTYVDTNYVYSTKDSVVFYNKSKTAVTNVYHFPLTIGGKWINRFASDTSKVISVTTLSVQAGAFENTYLIQDKAFSPNYNLNRSQWFVPNVGLIKMKFREYNFGPVVSQSWELIQFQTSQ